MDDTDAEPTPGRIYVEVPPGKRGHPALFSPEGRLYSRAERRARGWRGPLPHSLRALRDSSTATSDANGSRDA